MAGSSAATVLSTLTPKLRHTLQCHTSDVNGVCFSQNLLATCAGDKTVRLWSLPDFTELTPLSPLRGHSLYVNCCAFNPLGSLLASCSTDGKLILWDLNTGRKEAVLEHPSKGGIRICKFSPNSAFLISCSDDETLCIWEVPSWRLLRSLKGHEAFVVTCAFSPDSKWLVSGSNYGELRVWDMFHNFGNCLVKEFEVHDLGVSGCDFSVFGSKGQPYGDGEYLLATCGQDSLVKLWEIVCAGALYVQVNSKYVLAGHQAPVLVCCFASHGKLLASGSIDKTVRLWDPLRGTPLNVIEGHTRYVICCAFSKDDVFLVSGSNDKHVQVWEICSSDENLSPPMVTSTTTATTTGTVTATTTGTVTAATSYSSITAIAQAFKPSAPYQLDWQKPVTEWTVDDVCRWLGHAGFADYDDVFRMNAIDGPELLVLSHNAMEKSLGIGMYGVRNKLVRARDYLLEQVSSTLKATPDEYLCPITREIMQDPVIASDGYTYERAAIKSWMDSGSSRSPMTNSVLLSQHLTPNLTVKMLIQRHITT